MKKIYSKIKSQTVVIYTRFKIDPTRFLIRNSDSEWFGKSRTKSKHVFVRNEPVILTVPLFGRFDLTPGLYAFEFLLKSVARIRSIFPQENRLVSRLFPLGYIARISVRYRCPCSSRKFFFGAECTSIYLQKDLVNIENTFFSIFSKIFQIRTFFQNFVFALSVVKNKNLPNHLLFHCNAASQFSTWKWKFHQ